MLILLTAPALSAAASQGKIQKLERRLRELRGIGADEGLGGQLGELVGLSPEAARLCILTLVLLLLWTHGRAIIRMAGVLMLSAGITMWAVERKARRTLFLKLSRPPRELPPPPDSKKQATPASAYMGTPLPAVRPAELASAVREVVRLHDECDALGAARLLDAIDATLEEAPTPAAVANELAVAGAVIAEVRARKEAAIEALRLFDEDHGWSGSLNVLGSCTRFRREGTSGHMTLRVDGVIEGVPLADVAAVWREAGLFAEWLPSCVSSKLLRRSGRVDVVVYLVLSVLGLVSRDAVLHGYGVDCLEQLGKILILARSVTADEMPNEAIPPLPAWPNERMEYHKLQVALEPVSPTTTRACLIMEVDPKLRVVPQAMVEGVLRRTLCIIFWQLARTARRIGHRSGPHYAAVEADPSFYREWLAPRLGNHFLKKRGSS